MTATYPETDELAWRIVIEVQAGPVDPRTADVIERVAVIIRAYGGYVIVR